MKSAYWYCIFRSFFFCLPPKLVVIFCFVIWTCQHCRYTSIKDTWWSTLFIPVNFGLGNFIIISCFLILFDHSDILNLVIFLAMMIFSNATFQVTKICVSGPQLLSSKFQVTQGCWVRAMASTFRVIILISSYSRWVCENHGFHTSGYHTKPYFKLPRQLHKEQGFGTTAGYVQDTLASIPKRPTGVMFQQVPKGRVGAWIPLDTFLLN